MVHSSLKKKGAGSGQQAAGRQEAEGRRFLSLKFKV
jgi:hypothetical protein